MTLLGVAFRNLLRAKRRNLLSGGTMALGAAALVLGNGLTDGIARQLTRNLVATQTGHLQVVARATDFAPWNSPFDAYGWDLLPAAVPLAQRIESEGAAAGVVRAVPYLFGRGTAMAGSRSTIGSIIGIDPAREPELAARHAPESGTFLPAGDDLAVYVAAPAARKLHLTQGDPVSFVVQTRDGAVNSLDATVCGVFAKGAPWDDQTFYISLAAAERLYDAPEAATNIKVTLVDASAGPLESARAAVRRIAGSPAGMAKGREARVETFAEAGRFSFSIIQANQSSLVLLSSFLFVAAAIGVVNAMLMSVHERTREIGTVRALGMRRRRVVQLFLYEGLALGTVAAAAGVIAGGGYVLWLSGRGIPMNTITLAWVAGGDRLFPLLLPGNVARAVLAIAALSTAAAVYPAVTASRMEPREALHHV